MRRIFFYFFVIFNLFKVCCNVSLVWWMLVLFDWEFKCFCVCWCVVVVCFLLMFFVVLVVWVRMVIWLGWIFINLLLIVINLVCLFFFRWIVLILRGVMVGIWSGKILRLLFLVFMFIILIFVLYIGLLGVMILILMVFMFLFF